MEEKYHLQTHPTEKAEEGVMGGCNYKKNLNNPKCFLNICNSVSFLKNMEESFSLQYAFSLARYCI